MNIRVYVNVYIDKNKDLLLIPSKQYKYGFGVAVEPIIKVDSDRWENIGRYMMVLLNEICEDPLTKDDPQIENPVFKELWGSGSSGYRQFTKKHICITMEYKIGDKKVEIYNEPRLPDGSYGTEKGEISEQYSIKYVSEKKDELIQEYFEKAYRDAERYLAAIGSKVY